MLDTALDALMLALAVRLGGGRVRLLRLLLGASAGAAIAALARTLGLGRAQSLWLWLPAAAVMMRIACGRKVLCAPLRQVMLLFCAAGLLGGMVLSFYGATGSFGGAYALGALAAAVSGVCAVRSRRAAQDVQHARITCTHHGRCASFDAMIDSGNTLRDYLTHLPVIVLAQEGRHALHLCGAPLRPIFAQTAGGRQRLDALLPQQIVLEADGRKMAVQAVIAFSPRLGPDTPALVPASLLGSHTDGIISRGG